ncbi:MAG: hypothetical protein IJ193_06250 [Bacilli bacterium]|nr:hypothetical protein [Bacilli bacterium]
MKESLKQYNEYLDKVIKSKKVENKEDLLEEILIQIKFFQHERLVHLIVTFMTAIATILFLFFSVLLESIGMTLLFLITFCLFVPYIFHYYYLENGVQALYKKYFQIKEK